MKYFGTGADGRWRVCGLPVSQLWRGDSDALSEGFEPENPSILVPKKYGLGWSLNLGALAVQAGWIRPDDSLPDLADHIPRQVRQVIATAPIVGGILTLGLAGMVAKQESVASKYSLWGRPLQTSSGAKAVAIPLILQGIVGVAPRLAARRAPESQAAIAIGNQADLLGVQSLGIAQLLASYCSARHPKQRQRAAVLAPLLWPVVSGGVQLICVKTALTNIRSQLQTQTAQESRP